MSEEAEEEEDGGKKCNKNCIFKNIQSTLISHAAFGIYGTGCPLQVPDEILPTSSAFVLLHLADYFIYYFFFFHLTFFFFFLEFPVYAKYKYFSIHIIYIYVSASPLVRSNLCLVVQRYL